MRLDARRLDAYFDLGAHATVPIVVTEGDREQSVFFFLVFPFFSLSLATGWKFSR